MIGIVAPGQVRKIRGHHLLLDPHWRRCPPWGCHPYCETRPCWILWADDKCAVVLPFTTSLDRSPVRVPQGVGGLHRDSALIAHPVVVQLADIGPLIGYIPAEEVLHRVEQAPAEQLEDWKIPIDLIRSAAGMATAGRHA